MKKIILLMAVVLVGTSVLADVSKPGAPSFGTSNDAINSSPSDAYKKSGYVTKKPNLPTLPQEVSDPLRDELDGIAMDILRAEEKRDNSAMQANFQKLMTRGNVENYYQPQIQVRPQGCPYKRHVTVNGRQLTGEHMCAFMGYEYKGKMREVGYCK